MLHRILIVLSILKRVFPAPNCTVLPENTICGPAYAGFSIANNTVDAFNNNLVNFVANVTTLASNLANQNICVAPAINTQVLTLRYQVSFQCAYFVGQAVAQGCPIPSNSQQTNGPLLCPGQCALAATTVQALASNTALCPNGKSIAVNSYIDYCNSLTNLLPQNHNLCNNGSVVESKFCGFPDEGTAKSQCASLSTDTCCKVLLTPPPSNTTTPPPPASSSSSQGGSKMIVVIVGSIIGALVSFGTIFAIIILYRKKQREEDAGLGYSNGSSSTSHSNKSKPPALDFEESRGAPLKLPSFIQDNRFSELYASARPESSVRTSYTADEIISLRDLPASTKRFQIVHPYESSMSDELTLETGNDVFMVTEFDDGWALGVCPYTGQKGAFPMVCVRDPKSRDKSMYSTYLDKESIGNRYSSMIIRDSSKPKTKAFSKYLDKLDQYDDDGYSP